jgi:hypothetical protein
MEQNFLTAKPVHGFDSEISGKEVRFSVDGKVILSLDRTDRDVMRIVMADFYFAKRHIEIRPDGLWVDSRSKVTGDVVLLADGAININC